MTWAGGYKVFTYDALGRRKSERSGDPALAGTIATPAGTTTYNWDHESRLTSGTGPGVSASCGCNGLDSRVTANDGQGSRTFRRDGAYVTDPVLGDGQATYTPGISESRWGRPSSCTRG